MIRGGLRARLIADSARVTVLAALMELGWFDPDRRHLPVRYMARPNAWNEPIVPNALTITPEQQLDGEQGFGGDVEDSHRFYVDIFTEHESLGWQLARDLQDILIGRLGRVRRTGPVIDVWNLSMVPPVPFTCLDVEDVRIDRAEGQAREWQHNWMMVRFDLVDEFNDEFGAPCPYRDWDTSLERAWNHLRGSVPA